jgi:DNA helicase IV
LWRRNPLRSATLVGDLAQAARPGAPASWAEILTPHVGDRFRVQRLTVNYRTPREIMDVAGDVLAAAAPGTSAPESVRAVGVEPLAVRVPSAEALVDAVVSETVRTAGMIGEGRLAVLCAPEQAGALRAALCRVVPELVGIAAQIPGAATAPEVLDARVAVLTVADSKGLEFDAVLLVEPAALLTGPTRGLADLYVALTRATRTLTVVHTGELPDVLARLEAASDSAR